MLELWNGGMLEYWNVGIVEWWNGMAVHQSILPFFTSVPISENRVAEQSRRMAFPLHAILSHPRVLCLLSPFAAKPSLLSAVSRGMEVEASTGALHSHSWQFDLVRQTRFGTANGPAKKTAGRREWTRNGITAQHIFAFIGG